ncbi:uncharacterized protein LOC117340426 [Pecten maximus]|uniref:uncharacterized protein LOC117340426 n=1 Tax=Pecten maximus TaxID=6579 RepID=UPI0014587AD2|nr:uncharacterized protein LOC117340426 [Pecten maximus]
MTPEPRSMEPLHKSELPSGPWWNLSMDFCGSLNTGDYLLVIIDEYSWYPVVETVKSVSANATIPVLDKVLGMFGTPCVIKSDNGCPFNSHAFSKYASHMGFEHRRATPRWPRANAQAESIIKPLMKVIRAAYIVSKNWKQELVQFLRQYRATPHTSTECSPYRLMFSLEPKTQLPEVSVKRQKPAEPLVDEQVRRNDSQTKYRASSYADNRNRVHHRDISVGDTVMVKNEFKENKLSTVYDPTPRMVTNKKGPMVTVSGNITRNVSRFKKVDFKPREIHPEEEAMEDQHKNPTSPYVEPRSARQPEVSPPPDQPSTRVGRPRREGKKPQYPKDYVC